MRVAASATAFGTCGDKLCSVLVNHHWNKSVSAAKKNVEDEAGKLEEKKENTSNMLEMEDQALLSIKCSEVYTRGFQCFSRTGLEMRI